MKIIQICTVILAALMLQACASSLSGDSYTRGEARKAQETREGIVVRIRTVKIEGERGELGAIAGTVAGAVLGSQVGGGSGRIVGGVVGGIAGGLAGSAIQTTATSANGIEITVRLSSGKEIAIVQEGNPDDFRVGERVYIVSSGSNARVTR